MATETRCWFTRALSWGQEAFEMMAKWPLTRVLLKRRPPAKCDRTGRGLSKSASRPRLSVKREVWRVKIRKYVRSLKNDYWL
jgi:hypothetical protein